MKKMTENGFNEYKNLILSNMDRFEKKIDSMDIKIDEMKTDITALKVKATVWGGVAGAAVGALASALSGYFRK